MRKCAAKYWKNQNPGLKLSLYTACMRGYLECTLIFGLVLTVYLANKVIFISGDSVPNSLIALNFLQNHTFSLELFRGSHFFPEGRGYGFVMSKTGHLTSSYPIGPAILTFPIYLVIFIYLKVTDTPLSLADLSFEPSRIFYDRLAAAIVSAAAVVFFYQISRLRFRRSVALISTFAYALGTLSWSCNSQGLLQHGPANLCLLAGLFFLQRATVQTKGHDGNPQRMLFASGVFSGFLFSIRPSCTLFIIAAFICVLIYHRRYTFYFVIGSMSALPAVWWNLHHFGSIIGGYTGVGTLYEFTFQQFITGLAAHLISPSRGLLVFSPVLIFSFFGLKALWSTEKRTPERSIMIAYLLAAVLYLFSFCFYTAWWGGHSFGPRYMAEIVPLVALLLNYYVDNWIVALGAAAALKRARVVHKFLFVFALAFSVCTQFIGVTQIGAALWNVEPKNVDDFPERLWQWRDSQIERGIRGLFRR